MRKSFGTIILFKVDFKTAYDFVGWEYLELVMLKIGFSCICDVSGLWNVCGQQLFLF
jgi:hypothetical protein